MNQWCLRVIFLLVLTVFVLALMIFDNQFFNGIREGLTGQTNATSAQTGAGYNRDGVLASDGNIRHCITHEVIGYTDRKYVKKAFLKQHLTSSEGEASASRRQSFKAVFDDRVWMGVKGSKSDPAYDGIQASGLGSSIRAAQEVIAALHVIIDHIKFKHNLDRVRLLDIPCGDMAWMSHLLENRPDVDYVGFDIVPDLIDNHRKLYTKERPNMQFYLVDVVSEGINSSFRDFNLVLSRHMLQHLTTSDAITVLDHISDLSRRQSTPVYLFTTTFPRYNKNGDLDLSYRIRYRPLNLELPPFSLEPPLCLLYDGRPPNLMCCYIGLWRLPLYQVEKCNGVVTNQVRNKFGFGWGLHSCVNWTLKA